MAEKERGVVPNEVMKAHPASTRDVSRGLETEISTLREEIGDLVAELDRRRREAFDLRLQLRRHPVAIALGGTALALALGLTATAIAERRRLKRQRAYKVRQLKTALERVIEHPERVARGEPSVGEKVLGAVGVAAATLLVKRALGFAIPATPRASQGVPASSSR
ncbi:MAG TPA: hypothetical protein VMK12_16140 [Anaeromyxobacteraceae bacterium]|nr:hypothetical protein [Anaeromyxobacteraceae bacterium]